MKVFSCDNCEQPLFFENVLCLHCGYALAVLPEPGLPLAAITLVETAVVDDTNSAEANTVMQAETATASEDLPGTTEANLETEAPEAAALPPLQPVSPAPSPLWQRFQKAPASDTPSRYRLCLNHDLYQSCNFAVAEHDPNPLCITCRQTRLLPDLSQPENRRRWVRVEIAKRRLFYTLAQLGLAAIQFDASGAENPSSPLSPLSPIYAFLADQPGQAAVMTGHLGGTITLNVAEADDDERARRRVALGEPYRTLLGHLRHESGHFYWDRLIRDGNRLDDFRAVFGDERQDYTQALQAHYAAGPASDWQNTHVSAYAQAHPWEDWAETWAHYLHMVDLLETAAAYHTSVVVPSAGPDVAQTPDNPFEGGASHFDTMLQQWVPVTLLLNSLNRSLGQNDAYPFALSEAALQKLRFVHEVIQSCNPTA